MAYTKTTWQNNVTDIDANNLNKIEQGIYDNSLVADAVTNTLNPTDTETYKSQTLTEGQITDVIGVNDILIKGQTSQDGEPTPSSPVDVNVVSGSNVLDIENENNKNLFDKNSNIVTPGYLSATGSVVTSDSTLSYQNKFIKVDPNTSYTISSNTNAIYRIAEYNSNKEFILRKYNEQVSKSYTITTSNNTYYIKMAGTLTTILNSLQIEQGSTATTYEPHQGKELPLDLPVENLFDKDNANIIEGFINGQTKEITSYNITKSAYISVLPNTTYTISKTKGLRFIIGTTPSVAIGTICTSIQSGNDNSTTKLTITSGANDKYLIIFYYKGDVDTLSEQYIINSIQIEQGSKANAYTPYGTEPIELCKIGNYQDYFYKSGSKWYLHKEVGKKVLNGTENWASSETTQSNKYRAQLNFSNVTSNNYLRPSSNAEVGILLSNYYSPVVAGNNGTYGAHQGIAIDNLNYLLIYDENYNTNDISLFKTWLASNNVLLYYVLATPTNTEITDTTLISQLEAIYNAPLYEETNITQTNNDLPMILDITACKDNINGIKAFIRK